MKIKKKKEPNLAANPKSRKRLKGRCVAYTLQDIHEEKKMDQPFKEKSVKKRTGRKVRMRVVLPGIGNTTH